MKARACFWIATTTLCTAYATSALAQPSMTDKAVATKLYQDAEKAMASGDFAAACPKYGESQQRDPQLGTLLHLADCYEKAGKLMSAWVTFNEAVEFAARKSASGVKEPRGQVAHDRAAALEGKLSNLVIAVAKPDTPGLEVRQNGTAVGQATWGTGIPVDTGSYVVTAQAPGKKPWTKTVEIQSNGMKVEVAVPVLEDDVGSAPAAAPPPPGTAPAAAPMAPAVAPPTVAPGADTSASPQRTIGWIVAGTGVVGLGVGTVFGLMSKSKVSDRDGMCPSNDCPRGKIDQYLDLEQQAKTDATISNIGIIVGGAALAAGVVLILTAPSPSPSPSPSAASVHLAPWAGANSGGVVMGGAW